VKTAVYLERASILPTAGYLLLVFALDALSNRAAGPEWPVTTILAAALAAAAGVGVGTSFLVRRRLTRRLAAALRSLPPPQRSAVLAPFSGQPVLGRTELVEKLRSEIVVASELVPSGATEGSGSEPAVAERER
jgi:hypothetical protein